MVVAELLLETLEDLARDAFDTFQWHLSLEVLPGCEPISECELENATRTVTMRKMIEVYGEEKAVMVTVEILRKMSYNSAAEKLKKKYAELKTAAAAAPAAPPATISAQQGSVIAMPSITGSTAGSVNINIPK